MRGIKLGKGLVLGNTADGRKIYLSPKQRSLHMQVIGASGRGKSKFIEGMIRQDIINNNGLCLIDPHGYLYNDLVDWCAAKGMLDKGKKKIILFDPSEPDWTFGYNPLPSDMNNLAFYVDEMVRATVKVWGMKNVDETPRMAKWLNNIYYTLAEKKLSLLEAKYLITAEHIAVRKELTEDLKEDVIRNAWRDLNKKKAIPFEDKMESSENKLNRFIINPAIKNIIGQTERTINFRKIMDEGHILLVNLGTTSDPNKRKISNENCRLLGTLMINEMYQRSKERPKGSRPFYLYIDECSYFINNDIERILVECRKFGLHLILAHQTLEQLRDPDLGGSRAIFQGVQSGAQNKVIFGGIGVGEAKEIAEDMFIKELNLEESVKSLEKPVVVDYEITNFHSQSTSRGFARGSGGGNTSINTSGAGSSTGQTMAPGHGILDGSQVVGTNTGISNMSVHGDSVSDSWSETEIETESEAVSEALKPVLKIMPGSVHSRENQIYKKAGVLVSQKTQHAIIRKAEEYQTHLIKTPTVMDGNAQEGKIGEFKEQCYLTADYSHETKLIEKQIRERHKKIEMKVGEENRPEEPESFRG